MPHAVPVDRPVLVKVPVVQIQKVPVLIHKNVPVYIPTPVHSHHSQHNQIGLNSAHYASDSHAHYGSHYGGSFGAGLSSFGATSHFGGFINGVPCDTNGIPLSGYGFGRWKLLNDAESFILEVEILWRIAWPFIVVVILNKGWNLIVVNWFVLVYLLAFDRD